MCFYSSKVTSGSAVLLRGVFELHMTFYTLTWNEKQLNAELLEIFFHPLMFQAPKQEVRFLRLDSLGLNLNLLCESFWSGSHAKVISTSTSCIAARQEKIAFCGGDEPNPRCFFLSVGLSISHTHTQNTRTQRKPAVQGTMGPKELVSIKFHKVPQWKKTP